MRTAQNALRACLENSAGSALERQTAVCGVLDPQHIPEYASDLRPCIQPFAPPRSTRIGHFKQALICYRVKTDKSIVFGSLPP
jgi:hypothetical protein